ncbi:Gfo/Idh/MocA family oxidoreductase [Paenibacillus sp. DXFW5]|uniref:Gfo/Idh/MocA family oxidoreductase n=1 Tax=Paenibacillus rhizolycopersici TaxID=2780073 RepID=A0ABS2H5Z2_9BACL|nr:Gfo/Idh/MocA family oxidoreductase [Paenibacillus rhizolycopersici]MBM6996865.1 Gfo/Idh/MocA family oxidoreductase [Paenibacillus rhizolycopersici]
MIHVAIIGAGAISPAHIQAYLQFPEQCRIVALCDIYPEKARQKADQFQLDAEVFADYTELLQRSDIDLVSVCTPPYTHADTAIAFLDAGKHVIVEKPMASSLEECDRMNEAAERNGKILSVVAQNRFTSPMMKLKHVLDTKLMGPIVHAQIDSYWWRGHSYYDLWWRGTWEKEGGGCTLNHAVHHIDLFQWMNGMPAEITAVMSNTSHDNAEVEDISIAIARYENGALAQLTSSVVHHGQEQQLIFQGKHARVSAPWKVAASSSKANGFPEQDEELEAKIQKVYDEQPELSHEGHRGQIQDVLNAIEQGSSALVDGIQGRRTLELITAIYQSASTGQSVKLPLGPESPFYTRQGILQNATSFYEKKTSVENFSDNTITSGGNS